MAHKRESMEDPDLICRVLSSASGKVNDQSSSSTEHSSKGLKKSSNSKENRTEQQNNDVSNDHFRILSHFSGSDDPHGLLRELQILPYFNMDSSGFDFDDFGGTSRKPSFSDMIQCLEGKSGSGNPKLAKILKESNWEERHYKDINEKELQKDSKCNASNIMSFFLVFSFLIQYLPVYVIAILYQIKITSSSSSFASESSKEIQIKSEGLFPIKQ